MIIRAELKCKQTGCEADPCAVDKVIELPSPRFRLFSRALLADYASDVQCTPETMEEYRQMESEIGDIRFVVDNALN